MYVPQHEHCGACHVALGRAFLDVSRARLARAAVDAAAAGQARAASDGAPQASLQAAATAALAAHRAAAEAARPDARRLAALKRTGPRLAVLLAQEADMAGIVAAGEENIGANDPGVLGYPARPLERHLADALARHAAAQAGGPFA